MRTNEFTFSIPIFVNGNCKIRRNKSVSVNELTGFISFRKHKAILILTTIRSNINIIFNAFQLVCVEELIET